MALVGRTWRPRPPCLVAHGTAGTAQWMAGDGKEGWPVDAVSGFSRWLLGRTKEPSFTVVCWLVVWQFHISFELNPSANLVAILFYGGPQCCQVVRVVYQTVTMARIGFNTFVPSRKKAPFTSFTCCFTFATLVACSGSFVAQRSAAAISLSTTSGGRRAVLGKRTVVTCLEPKGERCMLEEWICARFRGKDISGYLQIPRYLGGQNRTKLAYMYRYLQDMSCNSRCFCGDGRVCILFARRHF